MKAIWNGQVIAESNNTIVIEGNHYFPSTSIQKEYFHPSDHHTTCPWKGVASYYDVKVNGDTNKEAAWFYPETSALAKGIKSYVAFWNGVEVVE